MNTTTVRLAALALAASVGVSAIGGCSKDPQEKYNDALEQLKEARASRDDAQEQIQAQKDKLAALQKKLESAKNELQQADSNVDQASQNVNQTANDQVLFRTIQRELLDKDEFDEAAISVAVSNRVVTLSGNVPDDDTRKHAVRIASSQAGVKSVTDNLNVEKAEAKGEQQKSGKAQKSGQPDGGSGQSAQSQNGQPE